MSSKEKRGKNSLSELDRLVGVAKKLQQRAREEGRTTIETPAIDNYIEKKKKEAGSPPEAFEPKEH